MAYTISNAKSDLDGILKGQSTSKITSLTSLFNRAGRQVLLDSDPQETKRRAYVSLFDEVYDYTPPTDLKGNAIIDIRPQVNRTPKDNFSQTYSEQFDMYKGRGNTDFNISFSTGVKQLRIDKSLTGKTMLDSIGGVSTNGTWSVGDDATNLTADSLYFKSGSASLNFDLDGSGTTGYIENSTLSAIDLSVHEDQSSMFVWVWVPDSTAITNVILRWGSSSANYWAVTATTPVFGSFVTGWNLMKFDWNGATETGTPDSSAVNYSRVTITYNGVADTDYRVDEISSRLPEVNEIEYYSKYIFSTSAGVFQETTTDDTDKINLDTETYNLFLWKVAEFASQQTPDKMDVKYYKDEYTLTLRRYKALYKSEKEKPRQSYYRMPAKGRSNRGSSELF